VLVRFCFFLWLALAPASAQTRSVALTFDDLPAADALEPSAVTSINQRILSALASHHALAIGFVNSAKLGAPGTSGQDRSVLEEWIRSGESLGNHGFSHADLNQLSIDDFEQEILSGEVPLREILAKEGKPLEYFRFPFSHTGDTKEKHDAIASFLAQHGYKIAPCTIDNSDYVFDRAYLLASSRHAESVLARIRSEYLAYTSLEIDYYTGLHKQIFGHEIPHVMLLHANQLNADTLEEILKIFETKRYKFVALPAALMDPAYQSPDTLVTAYGPMWGYRWARERHVKVDGSAESEPASWISVYGRK
jgi:peptidoglycan/xylan/chitin deacetylase (PgdA/CDA1 family)